MSYFFKSTAFYTIVFVIFIVYSQKIRFTAIKKACTTAETVVQASGFKLSNYLSSVFMVGKSFPNNSYIVIFIQILCFAYFPELHTHSYYIRKKAKLLSICCPRRIFVVRTHTENPSQKMSNFDKLLNDSCFF